MPDVLGLFTQLSHTQELERLCESKGFRSKIVCEVKHAKEWVELRPFALVVLEDSFSHQDLCELASQLWMKNPLIPILVLRSAEQVHDGDLRLHGMEVVREADASRRIDELLEVVSKDSKTTQEPFSVMVVEDLDSPREILCTYLESMGIHPVSSQASAHAALSALETNPHAFQCVLTDIRMPEIDGRDLIASVRSHPHLQHLPIIALTAYGTVDCLVDCLKAGASGFLVKPPKRIDVQRELARAMRISARRASPRLASAGEADEILEALLDRGFLMR